MRRFDFMNAMREFLSVSSGASTTGAGAVPPDPDWSAGWLGRGRGFGFGFAVFLDDRQSEKANIRSAHAKVQYKALRSRANEFFMYSDWLVVPVCAG
jgi:hypothetical protein